MAACVDVSRGTAYGLSLSQMAVSFGSVLFFPAVHVQLYAPAVGPVNGTLASGGCLPLPHVWGLGLGPLQLMFSAWVVWFSFLTLSLQDKNLLSSCDYNQEGVESLGFWDLAFWVIFAQAHLMFSFIVDSPFDLYAVLLGVACMVYFSMRACAPLTAGNNTQTHSTLNVLSYMVGVFIVCSNIPGGLASPRGMWLCALVSVDGLLAFGHTWDREATMDTITNCRLFYVCAMSLGICLMYATWYDTLRVPAPFDLGPPA